MRIFKDKTSNNIAKLMVKDIPEGSTIPDGWRTTKKVSQTVVVGVPTTTPKPKRGRPFKAK